MTTIETTTVDSNKTIDISKNRTYQFIYEGSGEFELLENDINLHNFSSQNRTYVLTLNNNIETSTSPYTFKNTNFEARLQVTDARIYDISLKNKPNWLSIESSSGKLEGTPTSKPG